MNFYDVLYKVAKSVGISVNNIGIAIGKAYNYVSNGKHRGSTPIVTSAAKMLNVCGYALCAVKREEMTDSMFEIR